MTQINPIQAKEKHSIQIKTSEDGDPMPENLNLALQELKAAVAQNGDAPMVIAENALEQRFHGLNLHQLALLIDAPALGTGARFQTADGAQVERFAIDGNDVDRCASAAEQLLLDTNASLKDGEVREVTVRPGSMPVRAFVRDHNDIIYRITDKEAAIDPELTGALQRRRQDAPRVEAAGSSQQPVTVNDVFAFRGTAGEVLHGLAAVRLRNKVAAHEIQELVRTTGARNLDSALAVAESEILRMAFERILLASQQIETLLDAIDQRTRMLIGLIDRGGKATASPAGAPPGANAAKVPDGDNRELHEPF